MHNGILICVSVDINTKKTKKTSVDYFFVFVSAFVRCFCVMRRLFRAVCSGRAVSDVITIIPVIFYSNGFG